MKKLLCLSLLVLCIPAWSESEQPKPLYQVEVLLFQTPISESATETWPEHPLLPDLSKARQLSNYSPSQAVQPFELLPRNKFLLNQEQWVLTHKLDAKIIAHYAWLQDFASKETIHLYANPELQLSSSTQPPYNADESWTIDGTLTLSKNNYFNLSANLLTTLSINGKPVNFLFKQKRRLRKEEIHYLDHPLIGMIVKIKEVKKA